MEREGETAALANMSEKTRRKVESDAATAAAAAIGSRRASSRASRLTNAVSNITNRAAAATSNNINKVRLESMINLILQDQAWAMQPGYVGEFFFDYPEQPAAPYVEQRVTTSINNSNIRNSNNSNINNSCNINIEIDNINNKNYSRSNKQLIIALKCAEMIYLCPTFCSIKNRTAKGTTTTTTTISIGTSASRTPKFPDSPVSLFYYFIIS